MTVANLLAAIPEGLPDELCEPLLTGQRFRLERIVSQGQASPAGFWYDQPQAEWVLVVQGRARLRFADQAEPVSLGPGDYLLIPAHVRHRVEWTDNTPPTVWLALHYEAGD